jgi:hypothetical protein
MAWFMTILHSYRLPIHAGSFINQPWPHIRLHRHHYNYVIFDIDHSEPSVHSTETASTSHAYIDHRHAIVSLRCATLRLTTHYGDRRWPLSCMLLMACASMIGRRRVSVCRVCRVCQWSGIGLSVCERRIIYSDVLSYEKLVLSMLWCHIIGYDYYKWLAWVKYDRMPWVSEINLLGDCLYIGPKNQKDVENIEKNCQITAANCNFMTLDLIIR